jgi:glyoxylase-like metal-dependent hydrolase (beta-lactamase superfamily II)
MTKPNIKAFFDQTTNTISYVVFDPATREAVIIDSVLNFDVKSARTQSESADEMIAYTQENHLSVYWILETHAHADHITAANYLKDQLGAHTGIGAGIIKVQETFAGVFNLGSEFTANGEQFDRLFDDNDSFQLGELEIKVLHTPGHTPACVAYLIGDACFVGDTLFMPDFGTARTDFPQGNAGTLYQSIQKILALPPTTRVFVGHDYKAPDRDEYAWETTVADELAKNIHVGNGTTEKEFIELRTERDATLGVPALLLPAIQINIRAGEFPPTEKNGTCFLKIPLNIL